MNSIYLDYQSTTPVHPNVSEKMHLYWSNQWGNPHSSEHIIGWQANAVVSDARAKVAGLVGALPDDVIFTSGATEANNLAILGHEVALQSSKYSKILLSPIEHKCVTEANKKLAYRVAGNISHLMVDKEGYVDQEDLKNKIKTGAYIVSIMLVNNEIGTIQDIKNIGNLCKEYGCILHCDASQAPCTMDISWLGDYADSISLSSHKIYGPMGIGALIATPDVRKKLISITFGGGQEQELRSGTLPAPLCLGFGEACKLVQSEDFKSEIKRVSKLRDEFVNILLSNNEKIFLNGPELDVRHSANANLCFKGFYAKDLLDRLQPNLCASSGAACSSNIDAGSDTLQAIGLSDEDINGSIRFSFGLNNYVEEVKQASSLILDVLSDSEI